MVDGKDTLKGYTILITRPADQSQDMIDRIREYGGTAVCFPMIEITGPDSWEQCDKAIINMKKFDGIIFTSANAVRGFVSRLENKFPHAREIIKRRQIYAVGKKTKEILSEYGLPVDAMPDEYTAEATVHLITQTNVEGKIFLLPAGNLTRDVIENGLMQAGAVVERARVYTTKTPAHVDTVRLQQLLTEHAIDIITFFSPSSVHHFFELIDPATIKDIPTAVIGPTTYQAVVEYGLHPKIKPDEATGEELINSIATYSMNAE